MVVFITQTAVWEKGKRKKRGEEKRWEENVTKEEIRRCEEGSINAILKWKKMFLLFLIEGFAEEGNVHNVWRLTMKNVLMVSHFGKKCNVV